jgi:hypothetical protein
MKNSRQLSRIWLAILLLGFVSASCLAKEDAIVSAQLQAFLPQSCNLSGNFSQQKTIVDLPNALQSSGDFLFSCERGLIWKTKVPIVETLVYKAKGKSLRLAEDGQSEMLSGKMQKEIGKLLNNLIGADVDKLQDTFLVEFQGDQLILQPKKKQFRKFISAIHLTKADLGMNIKMLSPTETTEINIIDVLNLSELSEQQCADERSIAASACEWLFN